MRNPFNPRNWQGETWKAEFTRRLEATEGSVQEAHLRLNGYDNTILVIRDKLEMNDDNNGRDNSGEE